MRSIYMIFFILFILLTFGLVSAEVRLSDGSVFRYKSWTRNLTFRRNSKESCSTTDPGCQSCNCDCCNGCWKVREALSLNETEGEDYES